MVDEQINSVLRNYGSDMSMQSESSSYRDNYGLSSGLSSGQLTDFPFRSRSGQSLRSRDPDLSMSSLNADTFLDLDPVDSLDIGLPKTSEKDSAGPRIHIHLASKGDRGREKDEEKIAALLEASKLAKQSMEALKVKSAVPNYVEYFILCRYFLKMQLRFQESFAKDSERVAMRNHDLHKKLEDMARKERRASIDLARAQERAYWEGRLSDEARCKLLRITRIFFWSAYSFYTGSSRMMTPKRSPRCDLVSRANASAQRSWM